jgi:toxin HigB-1
MIRSFRDKDTERLATGAKVRQWEPFRRQAEKRLRTLDAATSLGDLAALNSNRLEALKGNRKGQYSIRVKQPVAHLLQVAEGCAGAHRR